jgi:hypothetical protein
MKLIMKSLKSKVLVALFVLALASFALLPTGCTTTTSVDSTGKTNTVTTIDPQKLESVKQIVNTTASAIFAEEIRKSPNHAAEISAYVRAIGSTFCAAKATKQFSPATLFPALETATAPLQAQVSQTSPLVIIAKNGLKATYQLLWNDKLTVELKDNQWPAAVVDVICTAVDQSLRDAGQPGVQ